MLKKGVYQRLGVTLKRGFAFFFFISSISDGKSCFSVKKLISTNERRAEHRLAGRNSQHSSVYLSICLLTFTTLNSDFSKAKM